MATVTWQSRDGAWSGEKTWPDLENAQRYASWLTTPEAVRILGYRPIAIRIRERAAPPGRVLQPSAAAERAPEDAAPRLPIPPAVESEPPPPAPRAVLRALLPILTDGIASDRPVDPALARRCAELLSALAREAEAEAGRPAVGIGTPQG